MNTYGMLTRSVIACLCSLLLISSLRADTDAFGRRFRIEFVTIGAPGNLDWIENRPLTQLMGGVDYVYRLGKYEISRGQVERANELGGLGITLWSEGLAATFSERKPATGISRNEAARFVNYLNEAAGFPLAYKFAHQPGDPDYSPHDNLELWQPGDPGYNPENPFRNSLTRYVIPDQHEWYKGLHYNPTALDNRYGGYEYLANDAGWILGKSEPGDVTEAASESWFGTIGQFGNAQEIVETAWDRTNDDPSEPVLAFGPDYTDSRWEPPSLSFPTAAARTGGFRVASIPEPSTLTLSILPLLFALHLRRRRK